MRTKRFNLSISLGNDKLGPIPNWSLQAGITCPMNCKGCYATKGNHTFPSVQESRIDNTDFVRKCAEHNDWSPFIEEITDFLNSADNVSTMFRIHETGDFYLDRDFTKGFAYAKAWYNIIENNPHIRFCAFTKAYDVLREVPFYKLPNANILLSSWIGLDIPKDLQKHYRIAWFKDRKGEETRIPGGSFVCPGKKLKCIRCGYCWKKEATRDIVLNEH